MICHSGIVTLSIDTLNIYGVYELNGKCKDLNILTEYIVYMFLEDNGLDSLLDKFYIDNKQLSINHSNFKEYMLDDTHLYTFKCLDRYIREIKTTLDKLLVENIYKTNYPDKYITINTLILNSRTIMFTVAVFGDRGKIT